MEDLKSYYDHSSGELDAETSAEPLPAYGLARAKERRPIQRRERLEHQLQMINEQGQKLKELTGAAQLKNGEKPDTPARLAALDALIQVFYKTAGIVRVNLKERLRSKEGQMLQEFAMKKLSSDAATAERQKAVLEKHVEIASRYFPDLELRFVQDKEDHTVAVVLGVSAEAFNAVVLAEKTQQLYEERRTEIEKEIKSAEADLAKERQQRLAGGASDTSDKRPKNDIGSHMVVH